MKEQTKQNGAMSAEEFLRKIDDIPSWIYSDDDLSFKISTLASYMQAFAQHVLESQHKGLSDEDIEGMVESNTWIVKTRAGNMEVLEPKSVISLLKQVRDRVSGGVEVINDEDYERKINAFKHHRNK